MDPVPTGAAQAAGSDRTQSRYRFREWPIVLVLLLVLAGLAVVVFVSFRRGCVVIAGAVMVAFFLRALLHTRDAGMLAVRTRAVDLLVLALLGGSISVLSFWVPTGG